ncbi:hypothetical protein KIN20_034223 [Parelaphostrongylus tenuis]|uniref:Uncharacterized protein n=1 Tax=Parelaphostrongylus tenuis TaxID=148309 RepID=A0AAD5R9P5_PARTN|nr:hypothetical protein KIN20_034223 [Parelaphostrongylus tenuis]
MMIAYRENTDFFNYNTLVLPWLSGILLTRIKRKRIADIRNNIELSSDQLVLDDQFADPPAI